MKMPLLAPNARVSLCLWKENARKIELALRHVRDFTAANAS